MCEEISMLKELPDSNCRFLSIRTEDLVYIDKTRFIEKYENLKKSVSLLLRPRRFGKTLFTEILFYYYDVASKELSEKLFKGTYIHDNPTSLKSSFAVLRFDFSGFQTNYELLNSDLKTVIGIFKTKIIAGILDFYTRYPNYIPFYIHEYADKRKIKALAAIRSYYSQNEKFPTSSMIIEDFFLSIKENEFPYKIMLIIDEYDNFTNDILTRDKNTFVEVVNKQSEMGAFYGNIRSYHQAGILDRVFITGILPITMDTMISGFVSSKISQDPNINELAGFTDDEVLELLGETVDFNKCSFTPKDLQNTMKEWFNGYRFAEVADKTVYNSTLCLNFVQNIQNNPTRDPELTTSSNMDISFDKLVGLLKLLREDDRNLILDSVAKEKPIKFTIPDSIKIDNTDNHLGYGDGVAILFYLGFLTVMSTEEAKKTLGKLYVSSLYLKVPNLYFKMQFTKFMLEQAHIQWDSMIANCNAIALMAEENNLTGIVQSFEYIKNGLVQSDITHESEASIVMAIYGLLMQISNQFELTREYAIYHNSQVLSDVEIGKGFAKVGTHKKADLVAINKSAGKPSYIFEFKYKRNENSSDETKAKVRAKLLKDAYDQLNFYVTDDRLKKISNLHKYVIMYSYGEFLLQEIL